MSEYQKISFHIKQETAQSLDELCQVKGASRSEILRYACEEYFDNLQRKKDVEEKKQFAAELTTIGIDILLQKFTPEMRDGAHERARNNVDFANAR